MDRLIIPVNVTKNHWFVICVLFGDTRIVVYDSLPAKDGRMTYLNKVFNYIQQKYFDCNGEDLPKKWRLFPCYENNTVAPRQGGNLNCGVYTAMFMELLLNKMDPSLLIACQANIETNGRHA